MEKEHIQPGKTKRGAYFLANDKMYDFTIAFLNSFRTYNPDLPLCLIPYDADCEKIMALNELYHFVIFANSELLMECDQFSLSFHGIVLGSYRKLVMWEGFFEDFIYMDIDAVVTDDVSFAFPLLDDYDFIAGSSNLPNGPRYVWMDNIADCEVLNEEQIRFSANMGIFIAKKRFMSFEEIRRKAQRAIVIKEYMQLTCQDQPFLNYLVVTSERPYTSLSVLAKYGEKRKILSEYWGGDMGGKIRAGKIYSKKVDKPIFFVHWAGVWRLKDRMPNKKLWDYYQNMKAPAKERSSQSGGYFANFLKQLFFTSKEYK